MRSAFILLALAALLTLASARLSLIAFIGRAPAETAQGAATPPATASRPDTPRALVVHDVSQDAPATHVPSPLFRPLTPPPPARETQAGESFRLVGLAGEGEARVAFLRDDVSARTVAARAGDAVAEWRLERFDGRCVELLRARQRQQACM